MRKYQKARMRIEEAYDDMIQAAMGINHEEVERLIRNKKKLMERAKTLDAIDAI